MIATSLLYMANQSFNVSLKPWYIYMRHSLRVAIFLTPIYWSLNAFFSSFQLPIEFSFNLVYQFLVVFRQSVIEGSANNLSRYPIKIQIGVIRSQMVVWVGCPIEQRHSRQLKF